ALKPRRSPKDELAIHDFDALVLLREFDPAESVPVSCRQSTLTGRREPESAQFGALRPSS
ncbi:MAG: hypothetical protein ABIQ30_11800, partial [Devosia sp.]